MLVRPLADQLTALLAARRPALRLLFVVNVAWFFLSHRLPFARAARDAGYDVHVALGGATREEIEAIGVERMVFHPLSLERSSMDPLQNLRVAWQLGNLFRRIRPAIVHNVSVKPVMLGTLAARMTHVPAVVNAVSGLGFSATAPGAGGAVLRRIVEGGYRLCLRHPNTSYIFQNHDDRQVFRDLIGGAANRGSVIPGVGVDLVRFAEVPPPDSRPIRIVLPARMLRDKGVVEFARAVSLLRSEGLAVEGVLAGPIDLGNRAGLAESEIGQLTAETGVAWLGAVDDMPRLLGSSHIVCLPSYREGFPLALAEAAATGRPIVTTDVPGCRDVVSHESNGLLVPVQDVAQLASALRRLVHDRDLRVRLGAAGRTRAEAEFGLPRIVEQTLGLYAEVTGSPL